VGGGYETVKSWSAEALLGCWEGRVWVIDVNF